MRRLVVGWSAWPDSPQARRVPIPLPVRRSAHAVIRADERTRAGQALGDREPLPHPSSAPPPLAPSERQAGPARMVEGPAPATVTDSSGTTFSPVVQKLINLSPNGPNGRLIPPAESLCGAGESVGEREADVQRHCRESGRHLVRVGSEHSWGAGLYTPARSD